jgi:hypothetical protein
MEAQASYPRRVGGVAPLGLGQIAAEDGLEPRRTGVPNPANHPRATDPEKKDEGALAPVGLGLGGAPSVLKEI